MLQAAADFQSVSNLARQRDYKHTRKRQCKQMSNFTNLAFKLNFMDLNGSDQASDRSSFQLVLNAMGPVNLIILFILTTTGAAHSGVFGRHPALLSILRDIKQMGSSADGVTACETRLYLQVHPYQAQQADMGTPVFHQRIRRWTAEDGVQYVASTPSLWS